MRSLIQEKELNWTSQSVIAGTGDFTRNPFQFRVIV